MLAHLNYLRRAFTQHKSLPDTGHQAQGDKFSLLTFVRQQTELCRVIVRGANLSWVKRYPALVVPNPRADKEGIAGYEIVLNFNGLPYCEYHSRLAYQPVSDRRRERDTRY